MLDFAGSGDFYAGRIAAVLGLIEAEGLCSVPGDAGREYLED
ncbi:MAG: hypothetical protein N838_21570 [Thiohalocapsa sp. PB-PSB1]|nr:MAG: hypothetical protein N838_21570 [Thiohalocapsa sp. PB-PSB1]